MSNEEKVIYQIEWNCTVFSQRGYFYIWILLIYKSPKTDNNRKISIFLKASILTSGVSVEKYGYSYGDSSRSTIRKVFTSSSHASISLIMKLNFASRSTRVQRQPSVLGNCNKEGRRNWNSNELGMPISTVGNNRDEKVSLATRWFFAISPRPFLRQPPDDRINGALMQTAAGLEPSCSNNSSCENYRAPRVKLAENYRLTAIETPSKSVYTPWTEAYRFELCKFATSQLCLNIQFNDGCVRILCCIASFKYLKRWGNLKFCFVIADLFIARSLELSEIENGRAKMENLCPISHLVWTFH